MKRALIIACLLLTFGCSGALPTYEDMIRQLPKGEFKSFHSHVSANFANSDFMCRGGRYRDGVLHVDELRWSADSTGGVNFLIELEGLDQDINELKHLEYFTK